ncbi:rho GTPase-activating protein SYDE2 [Bufo bufo]|uniref:rho GTPase-activating protein SYDE2 n=1 Tax=Bufo bufo TaxID=8384 RepID=UPI001ABE52FB|nr:rho GTPase-activating protein SYDE2 [Bufo bufo]
MADPLRRTLSKLRGKRSKKGSAGGLSNGEGKEQPGGGHPNRRETPETCNGVVTGGSPGAYTIDTLVEPPRGCRGDPTGQGMECGVGDPVEILLGSLVHPPNIRAGTPGGWSPQNHNNNNDNHPALGCRESVGCRHSHYSNISSLDFEPQVSCAPPFSCDYSTHQILSAPPLKPPNSAPYSLSPDFEEHWPPHSAPSPLNFIYPHMPESRVPHDPRVGLFASEQCNYSGNAVSCHNPPLALVGGGSFYPRNHSEDSEEEDYYDNENLLVAGTHESRCNNLCTETQVLSPRTPFTHRTDYGHQDRKGGLDVYLETDRLRSQLQEAYYLLIHAMHDMPLERPGNKVGTRLETSPSSSQSQDSVYSQSSARVVESDVWSSDEASPKQVSRSDLASLNALMTARLNRIRRISKSLDTVYSLPAAEPLHKCHSDSQVKYSPVNSSLSSECGYEHSQGSIGHQADVESGEGSPQDMLSTVNWRASESATRSPPKTPGLRSDDEEAIVEDQGSASPKPSGLTVKKMQKWMYKGRLLSLEMKERLIGSSQKAGAGSSSGKSEASNKPELLQEKSDFIENTYTSMVIRRDLKVTEVNQHNLQHNHITVSKKRNWLTQSTHKSHHVSESHKRSHHTGNSTHVVIKETVLQLSRADRDASSKVPEAVPSAPATPQPVPTRTSDLSEDNDADDEGEIWYNPIPEDDELYICPKTSSDLAAADFGHDVPEVPARPGCLPGPGEPLSPATDNTGDSLDSSDYGVQLCKQRFVCKTAASLPTEDPPACGSHDPGPKVISPAPVDFSPPCSPNPVKKGGSINWSLPDKIKSPRTVRKLSMKMKKLPELSRKLSVKGTSWSHSSSDHPSSTSKGNCQEGGHATSLSSSGQAAAAASRNVISRYHLDSSVSSQHSYKKKSSGTSKSSSKGGYLSDGDSPELIAKSGKHGGESRSTKGKEPLSTGNAKSDLDIDAFRHYSFSDQPKCFQFVSGLMSLHFYGAEDLKPARIDSKDVFCAIQVDSVNKARTALLTCRTSFLDMDHTFNIELENAQHLKLVVFSWDPAPKKNRVCCHGTVILPALFRVTKTHQLAVKLEPRGLIYVKLSLMEQWENSADRIGVDREPIVFGVDARQIVEKENSGLMVPLLMDKCIMEIEKRGCQVVGLYRLCGSAAVKKELREAFERDCKSVGLCENDYPDINVITGVLKDYLRELPSPLITKQLYEAVLHAMAEKPLRMSGNGCENDPRDSEQTVELLSCLPDVERATLKMLLDHLKLVASYHEVNKMTCQNLAVCFGPVLLSQRQETSNHNNRVFIDSEELASALDFKKHIEVLHYLLQLWPVKNESSKEASPSSVQTEPQPCLRRKKPRPQMLNLNSSKMSGVLRPRAARLDSPSSNRYAGDWSSCQGSYLSPKEEADYADVPSESTRDTFAIRTERTYEHLKAKEHPLCTPTTEGGSEESDVNLHDLQESIDTLIGNLERELSKNKLGVAI